MGRWRGVLRVALNPSSHFNIAVSLCISSSTNLIVPCTNAIFFTGDRVEGTGNQVIERLSDTQNIAQILVLKFEKLGVDVNAWVIEASSFNGPFALYKEFIPCLNSWGEPESYRPEGFPASTSIVSLLLKCFDKVKKLVEFGKEEARHARDSMSSSLEPKTILFGFSKGGTVLNQLLTELANSNHYCTRGETSEIHKESQLVPRSKETLLHSISEIHYVDVGLNVPGAYLTDNSVIEKIIEQVKRGYGGMRFTLHGTPRQWCDRRRLWIVNEKDKLRQLLENATHNTEGRIQVRERLYFSSMPITLQMHFEVIEVMDLS